jgi:hypothetical protein
VITALLEPAKMVMAGNKMGGGSIQFDRFI